MSRLERLVNLTAALLNAERPLTSDAIRDRVPGYPEDKASYRRQFERDKDALRELGFPLVTKEEIVGSLTTYSVDRERYYLRDPGLTPDELSALTMASEVVRLNGLGDKRLYDAMWKLEAKPGNSPTNSSDPASQNLPLVNLDAELPTNATVAVIFDAIASGRSFAFDYKAARREVVPRSLSFEKGRWYLAAYDLQRSDERSFRIDRMDGELVLGADTASLSIPAAPPRTSPSRSPWELGEGEPIAAVVLIDAPHAIWAENHVGTKAVSDRNADGSIEVTLSVRNVDAFRSFVLGFLDGAEVLSPDPLRNELISWLDTKAAGGS
jgi:proteasome accessory factor B